MAKVSFANIPAEAPATAAPAEAEAPINNAPVNNEQAVVPAQSQAVIPSDGYHEEPNIDPSDIKLPRLKLLQGTSDKKLLQQFGFGSILLKDVVAIAKARTENEPAKPATIVFVKLLSKTYTERALKFGDPTAFARSLAEVEEQGGTIDWRESRDNKKSGSSKPWYQVNANCLVLVQKPEDADDAHFPFEADGKLYCPAIYSVKSFAYETFFQEIATSKATGELRKGGWASRFIRVIPEIRSGKGNAEFAVPTVKFGDETGEAVRQLAAQY